MDAIFCFILFVYLFMIIFNDHCSHSSHRMGNGVERGREGGREERRERGKEREGERGREREGGREGGRKKKMISF